MTINMTGRWAKKESASAPYLERDAKIRKADQDYFERMKQIPTATLSGDPAPGVTDALMANNRKHQAALGRLYQSEKPGIVEALDPLLSELDARVLAYVESLDAARDAIAEVNRFATACQQPPLVPPPSESLADFHRNFMDWRARTARALHPPTPKPALKVEDYVFVLPS